MAVAWAQSQREGWLCQLYGKDHQDGTRTLPTDCVQAHILGVLEKLLTTDLSPGDAASQTASLILAQEDVGTPWSNHIGLYYHAVQNIDNEDILKILIDYLAELASLPDAINEGPGVKIVEVDNARIEPGQPVRVAGGKLWRDLPEFNWNLSEIFQGPEQYLYSLSKPFEPVAAMQAWKNTNTYLALRAIHPKAQTISAMSGNVQLGVRALSWATEYPPDTRLGKNQELHAPAAAQWLRIAGAEIERLCETGIVGMGAGKLWESCGGTDVCDLARLEFWKSQLRDLGY